MVSNWNDGDRWEARRWAARLTRVLVFVAPIAAAVLAAIVVARLLPEPTTVLPTIGWWAAVLTASLAASHLTQMATNRLLPLAALLNMSLVFPDRAPSRFRVALRSGSSGLLRKEVERAVAAGADDDPTRAAEFALALVASLGKHDRTTRGHAERTRAYADLLALEMGLSRPERDRLRWAALLHDIGKVRVDAAILRKETPLDDSEWNVVRRHPTMGYELVAPIRDFLGPWAQTILHHHERWDGMGYPTGVSGDDIALGARIVSVADAFDAMTAARSYQEPMPRRVAIAELTKGAGTQFDPAVVKAFLRLSVGTVRRIAGPLSLLAQLPFIGGLRRVGDSGALVAAAIVAVVASVSLGVNPSPVDGDVDGANQAATESVEDSAGASDLVAAVPESTQSATPPPATAASGAASDSAPGTSTPSSTTLTPTTTTTTSIIITTTTTTTTTRTPPAAPVVESDVAVGEEDSGIVVDVLSNDSDPDGDMDPASLAVEYPPLAGSVAVMAAEGRSVPTLTYIPDPDFNGTDAFTYRVCDSTSRCSVGEVTVVVTPVNDPPRAEPDDAAVPMASEVVIDVLANDVDVDGDVVSVVAHDATTEGGGAVDCTATCRFVPPSPWIGPETFEYTIADASGETATATVTIAPAPHVWYLRNNDAGTTVSAPILPLSSVRGPTNAELENYDSDRDAATGLWLAEGPSGVTQQLNVSDPTQFQMWALPDGAEVVLYGSGRVAIHAGMRDLVAATAGRLRIFLLDCDPATTDGSDCIEIATATVTRRPWSDADGQWERVTAHFGPIDHTIAPERVLALKVVVAGGESEGDMWLAFDAAGLVAKLVVAP